MISCVKRQEYGSPLVVTGDVTNITKDGAHFNAKIMEMGKNIPTEYGFVWDINPFPILGYAQKHVIHESIKLGVFSSDISTTLVTGVKYYVRAYVKTNDLVSYGKEVAFMSLGSMAPKITDFKPITANLRDTLLIFGQNFSNKAASNLVNFGNFQATVIKATQDTLWVLVPGALYEPAVSVTVSIIGNEATSAEKFSLIPPAITDFNPKTGSIGSVVTIFGKNFKSNPATLIVYFDKYIVKPTDIHDNYFNITVPDSLDQQLCNFKVKMNNLTVVSTSQFSLGALAVTDFNPKIALTGSTIILNGNNFSPIRGNNIVNIGGLNAVVTKASVNSLEVTLPLQDVSNYSSRKVLINVKVHGESKDYTALLEINDKWFRLKNTPITQSPSGYTFANCFVSNGLAYIVLNNTSVFWEYDPANDKWKRLADFPGKPRWNGVGFMINGIIYFGTGTDYKNTLKDWWMYDISSNKWSTRNDFAGEKRYAAVAFQIDNSGYLGTGKVYESFSSGNSYSDFWKYTPDNDSWSRIANYPMFESFGSIYGIWYGFGIVYNNNAYVGLGNALITGDNYGNWIYKYNPVSNTWQRIANFPLASGNNNSVGFTLGNNLYIRTAMSKDFYYYNDASNTWTKLKTDISTDIDEGIAFANNGKIYIGLGRENAMWEYDPSR